jgi:hypothetical protein
MIPFRKSGLLLALLFGAAFLGVPAKAHATFMLQFSTNGGASWQNIADNSAGDQDSEVGSITTKVGALTIHANITGFVSPDVSFFDVTVSGTAAGGNYNLVVRGTLDGITTAPPPQTLSYDFTGSIGQQPSSSLTTTMRTWINTDPTTVVADTGSLGPNSSGDIVFIAQPPYSITGEITVSGTSIGTSSLSLDNNNMITPAPAPSGVVLALAGLPFAGFGCWLRRRKTA